MKLLRPISLRLLFGIVSLAFVSLITFLAANLAPGDAARIIVGEKGSEAAYQQVRKELGLDLPIPTRFASFIGNAVQGDFGRSYVGTREPVADKVKRNLPMTLRIAAWAILLATAAGILLGTLAAIKEDRWLDKVILTLSTLGVTVPNFVLAPVLVLIFAVNLDVLPTTWTSDRAASDFYYLVLPVTILSLRPMASITRLTRASMIDTLKQEFIRLAIAKGVAPFKVITKHALRNAILPVLTSIGTSFGFLLTGSFIIETAFTLPGLGREAIEAIQKRDIPTIQATTLVAGAIFILINLVIDVLLPILDPRIREAQV